MHPTAIAARLRSMLIDHRLHPVADRILQCPSIVCWQIAQLPAPIITLITNYIEKIQKRATKLVIKLKNK